ncbi:MAG TPA: 50S ribosomal protein L29 [Candidatus Saccharibacteria bacterium]|nr:50S ribosomal protein L29 [Candidatus Saccharibacteria bacterium]
MANKSNVKKSPKDAQEVKTVVQLKDELTKKQADLLEARRGHRLGELTNPRVITLTRKEIARLHTAIKIAEKAKEKEDK